MSKLNNVASMGYVEETMSAVFPSKIKLVEKVVSQKKIKVDVAEVNEVVDRLYQYFKYFNSLDEHVSIVLNNIDINRVQIPKEFADFIIPSAVRFDPANPRSKNLVVSEAAAADPGDYNDYVNLCDTFRGYFKKDANSDMVDLVDCKKAVNLQSVIAKASCDVDGAYRVNYGNEAFYPIRLKSIDSLYEDRHFNATESDLVADYLSNFQL